MDSSNRIILIDSNSLAFMNIYFKILNESKLYNFKITCSQDSMFSKIFVPGIFPKTDVLALCDLNITSNRENPTPIYKPTSTSNIITPK
jgi:hypothetical protein